MDKEFTKEFTKEITKDFTKELLKNNLKLSIFKPHILGPRTKSQGPSSDLRSDCSRTWSSLSSSTRTSDSDQVRAESDLAPARGQSDFSDSDFLKSRVRLGPPPPCFHCLRAQDFCFPLQHRGGTPQECPW